MYICRFECKYTHKFWSTQVCGPQSCVPNRYLTIRAVKYSWDKQRSQSARHSVTSAPVGISFFTTFMPLSDMSRTQQEAIFEECMKDIDDLDSKQFPLWSSWQLSKVVWKKLHLSRHRLNRLCRKGVRHGRDYFYPSHISPSSLPSPLCSLQEIYTWPVLILVDSFETQKVSTYSVHVRESTGVLTGVIWERYRRDEGRGENDEIPLFKGLDVA